MSNPYAPPDQAPGEPGRTQGDAGRTQVETRQPQPDPAPAVPGAQPEPAERLPPDPEAVQAASRRVMHFGLAMLATLVTAALPLPWQAAGLAFAVTAIVLGVRALHAVWSSGARGALVPVLGVGLAFAALMTLSLATMLVLWPLQVERQDCLRDALTISATEACETQFQGGLSDRLEQIGSR